jgi:hypothetical protein
LLHGSKNALDLTHTASRGMKKTIPTAVIKKMMVMISRITSGRGFVLMIYSSTI